jgi:serine/threonine-protein kinase
MYRTGEGRASLLEQARLAQIPPLPPVSLPEPDELRRIIERALAPDRAARYASAAVMRRDLDDYAAAARMNANPLRLGDWLQKTFGEDIVAQRRSRERAAAALERGAPVQMQPIPPAAERPATSAQGRPGLDRRRARLAVAVALAAAFAAVATFLMSR